MAGKKLGKVPCPKCGKPMYRRALLCRDCYLKEATKWVEKKES
jgi:NMD protein affecting ribosome stability and mRNA decay